MLSLLEYTIYSNAYYGARTITTRNSYSKGNTFILQHRRSLSRKTDMNGLGNKLPTGIDVVVKFAFLLE